MTDSQSRSSGAQSFDARQTPEGPSLDVVFDVLADRRRRYALRSLRESRLPMALADLAAEVAARERGRPISDVPVEEVKRVYASLRNRHLPSLVDANVVEYTDERGLVTLSSASERVEPFLAATADRE